MNTELMVLLQDVFFFLGIWDPQRPRPNIVSGPVGDKIIYQGRVVSQSPVNYFVSNLLICVCTTSDLMVRIMLLLFSWIGQTYQRKNRLFFGYRDFSVENILRGGYFLNLTGYSLCFSQVLPVTTFPLCCFPQIIRWIYVSLLTSQPCHIRLGALNAQTGPNYNRLLSVQNCGCLKGLMSSRG